MITLKISFLIGFAKKKEKQTKKTKRSKRGESAKTNSSKKSRNKSSTRSKKSKNSKKTTKEEKQKPPNVMETGPLLGYAHVDFKLLPNMPIQSVDVVCHENIAKIFNSSESKFIKVLTKDNVTWVPVHLVLKTDQLDLEKLISLAQTYVVNCNLSINQKKIITKAKNDKTKEYYCKTKCDSCLEFEEIFQNEMEALEKHKTPDNVLVNINNEVLHMNYINKILNGDEHVYYKEFVPFPGLPNKPEYEILSDPEFEEVVAEYAPMGLEARLPHLGKMKKEKKKNRKKTPKKSKDTKSKKSKKSKTKEAKKQKTGEYTFQISGETFFTNPKLCVYKIKCDGDTLSNFYVLITVDRLMTADQIQSLKPFVINVRKLMNVPIDFLLQNKFASIYLRYSSTQLKYSCRTEAKILKDFLGKSDIRFDEGHVCFLRDLNAHYIQEFFQTRLLKIEIIAIRHMAEPEISPANLFGTEKNDPNISKLSTLTDYLKFLKDVKQPSEEVIAVACFDLSLTANFEHDVATAYCRHPENRLAQTYEASYKIHPFQSVANKYEINLNYNMFKKNRTNPVKESLLIKSGMCVKIEWYLPANPDLLSEIVATNKSHRRCIFIIKERHLAEHLLRTIMLHNQDVLTNTVILPNYFHTLNKDYLTDGDSKYASVYMQLEVITGFILDNFDTFLFCVESRTGLLMLICDWLSGYTNRVCKMLYNTNFEFQHRLYKEFLNYGGCFVLTMYQPLQDILSNEGVYMRGKLPIPCYEALMKLDLLLKSHNLSSIFQYNLLPTSRQLLSLDMEYGVAHRWCSSC